MFCFAVWLLRFPLLSSVGKSRRQSPCCCSLPGSEGPSHPSSRLTNLGCVLELLTNPLCEDVGFDTTPSTRTFTREQKSLLHGAGIPPWCSHKSFEPSVGAAGLAAVGRGSPQAQGSHLVQTSRFIFQGMNSCRVHSRLLLQKPLLCTTGRSLTCGFSSCPCSQRPFSCCVERTRIAH